MKKSWNATICTHDDINWLVAHQANRRIIDATANRMGLDESKVLINIQKYGNTTSATPTFIIIRFLKTN